MSDQPVVYSAPSPAAIQDRVRVPGILLMVVAAINTLALMAQAAYYGLVGGVGMMESSSSMSQDEQMVFVIVIAAVVVISILGIAWNAFIAYAGWKMQKLENYNYAMIGSILAIVPCFSACCLLSMPAGIYALVQLNDHAVRDSFVS